MNRLEITTSVDIRATLTLNENQLRALDALAGYGADAFLRAFYIKLGRHYMQPFERDLRELFDLIKQDVPTALAQIKEARIAIGAPASQGQWIKKGNA